MARRPIVRTHAERREDRCGTRDLLVRAGIEAVLEGGWTATGIDQVLRSVGVPKGSFYYYFESKDDFGLALLDSYQAAFLERLERCFGESSVKAAGTFRTRMAAFLAESTRDMRRSRWRRGSLVGALGQEVAGRHEDFRKRLHASMQQWEAVLCAALRRAQARGQVSAALDPQRLARSFWVTWEGAVLRSRLSRSAQPLASAVDDFTHLIAR